MIIERGPDPGPFGHYREYKQYLRPLFRQRCAYCQTHDDHLGGIEHMTVDHFRPRRHKDLIHTWTNLYYSCSVCNEHYKRDHPDADEEERGIRFMDVCEEDPAAQICLVRERRSRSYCKARGKTAVGHYTVRTLHFNFRLGLRDYWRTIEANARTARSDLRQADKILSSARRLLQRFGVSDDLRETMAHAQKVKDSIEQRLIELLARRPFPIEK